MHITKTWKNNVYKCDSCTYINDIFIFYSMLNENNLKAFFSLHWSSFGFMLFHSGKI